MKTVGRDETHLTSEVALWHLLSGSTFVSGSNWVKEKLMGPFLPLLDSGH